MSRRVVSNGIATVVWDNPHLDSGTCQMLFLKTWSGVSWTVTKYGQLCMPHPVSYQKFCFTLFSLDHLRNVFLK